MQERGRRPRIADVAREAGVSKTAVSFAFNQPDRLNQETAQRIRDVAELLGYRPHPVARMLTQQRTMMIGVLTPQELSVIFGNPWFGHFSEGIAAITEEAGHTLVFISPLRGSLTHALERATVDGVVAVGLSAEHPEVDEIRAAGVPMVLVDSDAIPGCASVEIDEETGAREAAEHLLALGHREFLVIGVEPPACHGPASPHGVTARRLDGYRAALRAADLELPDDHVVLGPATIDGGTVATRRAWATGLRPTAVLAMSDAMAIGAMGAAREQGLTIPDEMSVVGFDDIELARYTQPPLTTIRQPIRQKGEEAVRLLLAEIEQREGSTTTQRRLPTRLVVRGSSGAAPTAARR